MFVSSEPDPTEIIDISFGWFALDVNQFSTFLNLFYF